MTTRINTALDRLLALAALLDAALLAWWLLRRSQRPVCARQSWVRRDEAAMIRDGLVTRRALWEEDGLITPDDLPRDE